MVTVSNFTNFLAILVFAIWIVNVVGFSRRDTTDAPGKSSGLVLYKDAATGVQYVGTVMGGITLRVDRDGKPYTDPQ